MTAVTEAPPVYGPAGLTWDELFHLPLTDPRTVPGALADIYNRAAAGNHWIRGAYDPPFEGAKVRLCGSRYELRCWLEFGNWSNGTAFAIEEGGEVLAFIQQGECSDEWLVVKTWPSGPGPWRHEWDWLAFESISWRSILTRDGAGSFHAHLDGLFGAAMYECRNGRWYDAVRSYREAQRS